MKKHLFFLLTLSFIGCKDPNNIEQNGFNFRKLSINEVLERAKERDYPRKSEFVYKFQNGKAISEVELMKIKSKNTHFFDNYVDEKGVVRLMVARPITKEDSINLAYFDSELKYYVDKKQISPFAVDCIQRDKILKELKRLDQVNRKSKNTYNSSLDYENLSTVVSLLEDCEEFDEYSPDQIKTIWLIILHGNLMYQEKYLSLFKRYVEKGSLSNRDLSLMIDKMLITQGEQQIYGTQICRNKSTGEHELCNSIHIDSIIKNREAVGFEPIEDYLLNWNIQLK